MARSNDFLLYQDVVPKKTREAIKGKLLEAEMHGYDTFIASAQYIMSELLAGNLPPNVAKEARAYLELILTAISAKNIVEAKTGKLAPTAGSVAAQLREARNRKKKMKLELTDHGTGEIEASLKALKDEVTV